MNLIILLLVLIAACASGATFAQSTLAILVLSTHVLLPGWLLRRCVGAFSGSKALEAFGAWSLGLCWSTAVFMLSRLIDVPALYTWSPVLALPFALRVAPRSAPTVLAPSLWLGLVLGVLCIVRTLAFAPDAFSPEPGSDAHFHAGNVAELLHRWPVQDIRLAGEPFRYHILSYAVPAGLSQVTGLPAYACLYQLTLALFPLLLGLGMLALATRWGQHPRAGYIAAILAIFHEDLGRLLGAALGFGGATNSFLAFGIHSSPSSCLSLVLVLALLSLWWEFRQAQAMPVRYLLLLGAHAALLSGVKGSAMPTLLAGIGIGMLVHRRWWQRDLIALGCMLLAALPYTLYLLRGDDSYASAMLRLAPGLELQDTALYASLGIGCWSALPWLVLFLGLGSFCAWWRPPASAQTQAHPALWGLLLTGVGAALLLTAPGRSHLFFSYPGQIALALLAGVALAHRPRWAWVVGLTCLACVYPSTQQWWNSRERFAPTALDWLHREGQAWMRVNLPRDAVLISEQRLFLHSVHSEREIYHETAGFTAARLANQAPAIGPDGKPLRSLADQRELAAARAYQRPSAATFERVRKLAPSDRPLYFIRESFQTDSAQGRHAAPATRFDAPELEPVFQNEAIGVYRLKP